MEEDLDAAQELIDSAMDDVKLVPCELCHGRGNHPEGLGVVCPRCGGKGVQVADDH